MYSILPPFLNTNLCSLCDTSRIFNITLSIENTDGVKIWKEEIEPRSGGNFSTLLIAAGGGWEDGGSYTLMATQNDFVKKVQFKFIA